MKPIRKCGSRSYQGPGTPSCWVQFSAPSSAIGWRFRVARFAPKNSSGAAKAWSLSVRLLIQTSRIFWPCQSVNRLTL